MMRIEPVDSKFAPRKKFAIGNKAGRAATQQLTEPWEGTDAFASEIVLLTASMWISLIYVVLVFLAIVTYRMWQLCDVHVHVHVHV